MRLTPAPPDGRVLLLARILFIAIAVALAALLGLFPFGKRNVLAISAQCFEFFFYVKEINYSL